MNNTTTWLRNISVSRSRKAENKRSFLIFLWEFSILDFKTRREIYRAVGFRKFIGGQVRKSKSIGVGLEIHNRRVEISSKIGEKSVNFCLKIAKFSPAELRSVPAVLFTPIWLRCAAGEQIYSLMRSMIYAFFFDKYLCVLHFSFR